MLPAYILRSSLFCGSVTTDTFSSFPSLGFILLLVFQTCGTLNVAQTHSLFCASPNDCRIHGLQSLRHCLLSCLFLPGKPAVSSLAESPLPQGQLPGRLFHPSCSQLPFPFPWQPKHISQPFYFRKESSCSLSCSLFLFCLSF